MHENNCGPFPVYCYSSQKYPQYIVISRQGIRVILPLFERSPYIYSSMAEHPSQNMSICHKWSCSHPIWWPSPQFLKFFPKYNFPEATLYMSLMMLCICDVYVMYMWCICDVYVMYIWCICMYMWCICDVYVMYMWCICDVSCDVYVSVYVMYMWCICDVMYMWCICDVYMMYMWCICDVYVMYHVMYMWCICDVYVMYMWLYMWCIHQ